MPLIRACLVTLALAGCGAAPNPESPSPADSSAVPVQGAPSSAAPSAAPTPAQAPSSEGPVPAAAELIAEVCPLFRAHFEEGRKFRFKVEDAVDPHGPVAPGEDPMSRSTSEVVCTVGTPHVVDNHLEVNFDCEGEATEVLSVPDVMYFRESALDFGEPGRVSFGCSPKAQKLTLGNAEDDDREDAEWSCSVEMSRGAEEAWCRSETCSGENYMYGAAKERLCFAAGRGLTYLRKENHAGPRTTTATPLGP